MVARETQAFLDRTVQQYTDPGMAVSGVVVCSRGELAGWAGLSVPTFLPDILPAVEVGWRLGEQHRGHGYATEAGRAWARYAFDALRLSEIVSIYEPENLASGAVMRRLGFTLDHETTHPTLGVPLRVMALTQWSWTNSGPPSG